MDAIKRRLTLIEAQLSGQGLLTHLMAAAPLFFPAVGLMAGIVLQESVPTQFGPWMGILIIGAVGSGACFVVTRRAPRPAILTAGLLVSFLGLGGLRLMVFEHPPPNDIRHLVGEAPTLATVRGRIRTSPCQERQDWCFARFTFSDPVSLFYLSARQIETDLGWQDVRGTVYVRLGEPTPNLQVGDVVEMHCWLRRFAPPTNPGQFDLAAYQRRRNIHLAASVASRSAITVQEAGRRGLVIRLRNRLTEAAAHALLPDRTQIDSGAAMLDALLLGHRENIDRQTYEAFRKTGLLHIISLSGLHLGILVGIVWWLGRLAGLLKPTRALVCVLATAAFLLVVPPRAPTVRAAVIVWAFCMATLVRRRSNSLNTLCLAAIILLLLRPTQLFEPGWQLSFSAVAGILALTDPIEGLMHRATRQWFANEKPSRRRVTRWTREIGRRIIRLFAAGLGAWLGGAGVLLYHFYTITLLTSLWTVLVLPLVVVLLTLGFFKIVLFFLLPTLSYLLGLLATIVADLFIAIVHHLARPDINTLLIGHVTVWVVVLYYGLVLFARFAPGRHRLLKHTLCLVMVATLVVYLGQLKWHRTHRDGLCMTVLDVGHGQAIVVQLPGTMNLLFDAGSMYQGDIGGRVVVPFLDYMGISRLDAVVISHPDIDHINGIPEIVERRRIDHVYAHEMSLSPAEPGDPLDVLVRHLERHGHRIETLPPTLNAANAILTTLWPAACLADANELSENDRSLVSLLEFAGVRLLLCSDIEAGAQKQIIGFQPNLRAQIVVVPHHGSVATRYEPFLPHLQPDTLIASSGRKQKRMIDDDFSANYFSTAENGAVTICVDRDGMVERACHVHRSIGD